MDAPKLIAFDLDETVLDSGMDVSAETVRMLKKAHEFGCVMVVATGRHLTRIPRSVWNTAAIDYIISSNGAQLIKVASDEVLYQQQIDTGTVLEIMDEMKSFVCGFNVQFTDRMCCEYRMRWGLLRSKSLMEGLRNLRRMTESVKHVWSAGKLVRNSEKVVIKFGMIVKNRAEALRICEMLDARYHVETAINADREVEITAPGTNKGVALAYLRQLLDIPRDATVAIGDSGNDIPMRESAGFLIAMGNASVGLKEVADYVTLPVWENGAAFALDKYLSRDEEGSI